MRIIICGAGQVGTDIAKYLVEEDNEITLVDTNAGVISDISDSMDVRAICGHASYPEVLEEAGAKDADMIVAVTPSDELNMVTCLVANTIFKVPVKIARIRALEYLGTEWSDLYTEGNMPIDVIISPEIEMAKAIERNLSAPGAMEVAPLLEGKVYLLAVRCHEDCPVIHTALRQISAIFPDVLMNVIGIIRGGHCIIPDADEHILEGDEVYLLVDSEQIARALNAFGHEEQTANHLIIFGAGRTSEYLAKQLTEKQLVDSITIVEKNAELASQAATGLEDVKIINGDFLETDILEEAGIRRMETAIALTKESEDNILGSLLVKRYGVKQTFALADKLAYNNLVSHLGIDIVLDPKAITISSIIQHIRKGYVHSAYVIKGGIAEVMEVEVSANAELIGSTVADIDLPKGAILGAIIREDNFIIPTPSNLLNTGDKLLFFVHHNAVKLVEKMFSPITALF